MWLGFCFEEISTAHWTTGGAFQWLSTLMKSCRRLKPEMILLQSKESWLERSFVGTNERGHQCVLLASFTGAGFARSLIYLDRCCSISMQMYLQAIRAKRVCKTSYHVHTYFTFYFLTHGSHNDFAIFCLWKHRAFFLDSQCVLDMHLSDL